jgi:DNA-directed RNA polymerase subunit F
MAQGGATVWRPVMYRGRWCAYRRVNGRPQRISLRASSFEEAKEVLLSSVRAVDDPVKTAEETTIYFISDGEFVKIGRATNVATRLSDLQVASPRNLTVLAIVDAPPHSERELHRLFEDWHVRGEWFRLSDQIRSFITAEGRAWRVSAAEIVQGIHETHRAIAAGS